MTSNIPVHFNGHRYHVHNEWIKRHYGGRMQKVSLDAGFTCPNRDGTRGKGGCTFCNNNGFSPDYLRLHKDLDAQIETGLDFMRHRYPKTHGFLAYFQPYSNTYADLSHLKSIYEQALAHPDIAGLVIGTRPDCLPDDVLDYLAELSKHTIVELEIGLESCNNGVLKRCNRGHTFEETRNAVQRAAERHLFITCHLLLGLPGETRETFQTSIPELVQLPFNSLKFHQLQIVKGTQLAREWRENPESFSTLPMEEYLDWVVDVLEYLPPEVTVQRLSSEVPERLRLSTGWNKLLCDLPALLEEVLVRKDTWQSRLRCSSSSR